PRTEATSGRGCQTSVPRSLTCLLPACNGATAPRPWKPAPAAAVPRRAGGRPTPHFPHEIGPGQAVGKRTTGACPPKGGRAPVIFCGIRLPSIIAGSARALRDRRQRVRRSLLAAPPAVGLGRVVAGALPLLRLP